MGYCVSQSDAHFLITRDNIPKALAAIKAMVDRCKEDEEGGGRLSSFRWVDTKFAEADTLDEALDEWRWGEVEYDKVGNLCYIRFQGEKLGDDVRLFEALAPFVEHRSYIEMLGEDDTRWRWVFWRGELREEYPRIIWEYENITDVQDLMEGVQLE
jgi:hypothetical protein